MNISVTGKDSKSDYLKSLGAKNIINRAEFDKDPRLIDKGLWDGVVDTVGGKILANAIVQTNPNGIITVCGNANTNELNTSVIPFMLRGIKLWGIDSANCSIKRREFIWSEAANLIDFSLLEKSIQTISLEELIETYPKILKGEISGRVLVDFNLLEKSIQTVSLEELIETYPKILKGEISGRVLVDLNK